MQTQASTFLKSWFTLIIIVYFQTFTFPRAQPKKNPVQLYCVSIIFYLVF